MKRMKEHVRQRALSFQYFNNTYLDVLPELHYMSLNRRSSFKKLSLVSINLYFPFITLVEESETWFKYQMWIRKALIMIFKSWWTSREMTDYVITRSIFSRPIVALLVSSYFALSDLETAQRVPTFLSKPNPWKFDQPDGSKLFTAFFFSTSDNQNVISFCWKWLSELHSISKPNFVSLNSFICHNILVTFCRERLEYDDTIVVGTSERK